MSEKQFIVVTFILQSGHGRRATSYQEIDEYIGSFEHCLVLRALTMSAAVLHTDVSEDEIRLRLLTMIEPEFDRYSVDVVTHPEGLPVFAHDYVSWVESKLPPGTRAPAHP